MATIIEKQMDLFKIPQGWWLTHCVSSDFEMGAGIAKQFKEVYNGAQQYLRNKYVNNYPAAVVHSNVIYLVTKYRYFNKPTYDSLQKSLYQLRTIVNEMCIKKLAMPKIGCGLDKLNWETVKEMIDLTFENNNDLTIVVCYK